MEFEYQGKRHIISWEHHDGSGDWTHDAARASIRDTFLRLHSLPLEEQQNLGVPHKIARRTAKGPIYYDGMTVCRIKTLKPDADALPPAERWETVAEGYSFKRSDDKVFDKRAGRRLSLVKALSSWDPKRNLRVATAFDYKTRYHIWTEFNTKWPPISLDASILEKKYAKLQADYRKLETEYHEALGDFRDRGRGAGSVLGALGRMP